MPPYVKPTSVPTNATMAYVFVTDSVDGVTYVQRVAPPTFENDPIGPSDTGLRGWGVPANQITPEVLTALTNGDADLLGVVLYFDTDDWRTVWTGPQE